MIRQFLSPVRSQASPIILSPSCSRPCMWAFSLCSPCLVVCAVVAVSDFMVP